MLAGLARALHERRYDCHLSRRPGIQPSAWRGAAWGVGLSVLGFWLPLAALVRWLVTR